MRVAHCCGRGRRIEKLSGALLDEHGNGALGGRCTGWPVQAGGAGPGQRPHRATDQILGFRQPEEGWAEPGMLPA